MTGTINPALREVPLQPDGLVEIVVSSADLRVRGIDADQVVVRSRDGEPLGDDVIVDGEPGTVRVREGHVGVRIGPLSMTTGRSRDLDIDVPRTARVMLRTASGEVEAVGIGGTSRWASASGSLRIATGGGSVRLETMSGDAFVEADGAVDLGARTLSGDLRIRASRLAATDVGTTSGDIRLEAELAAGGRHAISSVSGDVELVTPTDVRLEVETITGDVRAQGEHRVEGTRAHRTVVAGAGSVGISVRTLSGDVRLRTAGGAARPDPAAAARPGQPAAPESPVAPEQPAAPEPPAAAAPPEAPAPAAPAPELAPVAEAVAGPVAPRPVTDEDTQAWAAPEGGVDRSEAARLDVLRALERGDLDVETASHRLESLDGAGPRTFRGWC